MLPIYAWKRWNGETNFGDEVGTLLVRTILGQPDYPITRDRNNTPKLLAVGTILNQYHARRGDVVWGSGRADGNLEDLDLDVRAVRGPLTLDSLRRSGWRGEVPCGDPCLLLSRYFPMPQGNDVGFVRHYSDQETELPKGVKLIQTHGDVMGILKSITSCCLVLSSALHGLVVADAYGIPCTLVDGVEVNVKMAKYLDYFASTGRGSVKPVSLKGALYVPPLPPPNLPDLDKLLEAFPWDVTK